VFLPERNAKDILEVPQDVRNELSFVVVNNVRTVLDSVLETTASGLPLAPLATAEGSVTAGPTVSAMA